MKTSSRFIQLNFACIYLIWGSTYLVIQTALDGIPPYTLIFLRLLLASSVLFLIARLRSDERPTRKQIFNSFFLSIFFFILCNATVVWTQQFVNSGIVALLLCSQPLFIALFQSILNKERIPPMLIAGIISGIAGIALLQQIDKSNRIDGYYLLLLLFAALSGAIGAVLSFRIDLPRSPFINSGSQMIFASLVLGSISMFTGELQTFRPLEVPTESWMSFFYLVFFGSIMAYTSYNYLATRVSPNMVATHSFVNPLVAITLGVMIGGEVLNLKQTIPAILLIGAVVMMLAGTRKSPKRKNKTKVAEEASIL